jgi:energy-coupling factor transporter ATP-binding protein EcfA2
VWADLVRIWQSEKRTILFVTHDIEEAVQLADRVLVMSNRPATIQEVVDVDLPGRAIWIRPVIWKYATASSASWDELAGRRNRGLNRKSPIENPKWTKAAKIYPAPPDSFHSSLVIPSSTDSARQ